MLPAPAAVAAVSRHDLMPARLDSPDKILHQDPFVYQWDNWLPQEQIQDILERQIHRVEYTLGKTKSGSLHHVTDRRRCWNHIITPNDAASLTLLEQQASDFLGVDPDHLEPAVLLRYGFDDYFRPHLDTNRQTWQGKQSKRVATILIYLNDDYQGGETCFPLLSLNTEPRRGRAIHWRYDHSDTRKNDLLLHSGEPVKSGVKHAVCLFLRDQPFLGEQRERMSY